MPKTGIHWFRHGLRLHDNPALLACVDEVERFIPIFIFDGKSAGLANCGYNRLRFLLQSLKDLERQFAAHGIHFMCFYGEPHQVIYSLIKEWNVKVISFEKDTEAIWHKRDQAICDLCRRHNVQIIERVSHTLYDPEEIFNLNNDAPPNTCDEMRKALLRIGEPEAAAPPPDLQFVALNLRSNASLYDAERHRVPNIEWLGVWPECAEQEERCLFEGGETRALEQFKRRLASEKDAFRQGKINHTSTEIKLMLTDNDVCISPYLRYGCLSVRKFYWDIKRAYLKHFVGPKADYCPTQPLFWREYFYQLSYKNDKFDRVIGNPMSYQIRWDCMSQSPACKHAEFQAWSEGRTGFPWIDACMRQLIQEGWMHHICRNSVAVFLTRGALYLSWEKGMDVFMKYQIDADWSVNAGNWNWVSCGDPEDILKETHSTFCPTRHGKILDPEGTYIRRYVRELRDMPLEYLHEPSKAPLGVQEAANCIVGKHYPEPCVDHEFAYAENIAKLRRFFDADKRDVFESFCNDKRVLKSAQGSNEFQTFIYARFLDEEFDDF